LAKKGKKVSAYDAAQEFFVKSEWKKAILSFQKYTDESPKGKNVPDAKYKIGVCFQELGMKEEAMAFFEEVVANYAATEAGKKSKARLAKLKK
jgi:TolA-binding protein